MIANSFGVAICTVFVVIAEVCETISKYMGPKFISLPKYKDEMTVKVGEFEAKSGMKQAFGCIDGTHIPIKWPVHNSRDYFCSKQFYSLNIQTVCDYRSYFMDVEFMWPDSVHDAKVFANSSLNQILQNNLIPNTLHFPRQNVNEIIPNCVIGDPAYPLLPYCIKEYESCSNDPEVIFNSMLRSARNQIECAFGRLKARSAILTRKIDLKFDMFYLFDI